VPDFLKRNHDAEDGDALRLNGAVAINRQDFGMTYGKDKIDDLVEVRFSVDTGR
jgi:polyisoprenoid-binding protein YceI